MMRRVNEEFKKKIFEYKRRKIYLMIVTNYEEDRKPYYSLDLYIEETKWYTKVLYYTQIQMFTSELFEDVLDQYNKLCKNGWVEQ